MKKNAILAFTLASLISPAAFAMGDFNLQNLSRQLDGMQAQTVALRKRSRHHKVLPTPELPLTDLDHEKIDSLANFLADHRDLNQLEKVRGLDTKLCGDDVCVVVTVNRETEPPWNRMCRQLSLAPFGSPYLYTCYTVNKKFIEAMEFDDGSHFAMRRISNGNWIFLYRPQIPTDAGDGSGLPGTAAEMSMRDTKLAVDAAIKILATRGINDAREH